MSAVAGIRSTTVAESIPELTSTSTCRGHDGHGRAKEVSDGVWGTDAAGDGRTGMAGGDARWYLGWGYDLAKHYMRSPELLSGD